jgi:hypothetical protein
VSPCPHGPALFGGAFAPRRAARFSSSCSAVLKGLPRVSPPRHRHATHPWVLLEAGSPGIIAADRLGVAVGISGNEYARSSDTVSVYIATGGALSVAGGGVLYTFGVQKVPWVQ